MIEYSKVRHDRDAVHREMIQQQIFRSCINCEHFNEKTEYCGVAHQRPPAKVIVFGCPKWMADIPF
jgi:hypothetical protein